MEVQQLPRFTTALRQRTSSSSSSTPTTTSSTTSSSAASMGFPRNSFDAVTAASFIGLWAECQSRLRDRVAQRERTNDQRDLWSRLSQLGSAATTTNSNAAATTATNEHRRLLGRFLQKVADAVHLEPQHSFVRPAATVLFFAIHSGYEESKIRAELQAACSIVQESAFQEAVAIGRQLSSGLAAAPPQKANEASTLYSNDDPLAGAANEEEFGHSIEFYPPPRLDPLDDLIDEMEDFDIADEGFIESESSDRDDPTNRAWLKHRCEEFLSRRENSANLSVTVENLVLLIYENLASSKNDLVLQGDLFELLGNNSFDFVESLMKHRQVIVATIREYLDELKSLHQETNKMLSAKKPPPVSFGTQVTITTESEKQQRKMQQKQQKLTKKLQQTFGGQVERYQAKLMEALTLTDSNELQSLKDIKQEFSDKKKKKPLFGARRQPAIRYPHVYTSVSPTLMEVVGHRFSLPVGTIRLVHKDHEEISIPASSKAAPLTSEYVVGIEDFDEFARPAFSGYKSLNRLQSFVFHTAYGTNENLLICAPTGAGKTDVAMMTVLHELQSHVDPERRALRNKDFKIIYVAPMKALAAEVVSKFSSRLAYLGVVVSELTGDMQLTKTEISRTQMIVTTPEKWDVVTRKGTGDVHLTQQVKLLIIDEVHLLHDDRGPVIESLIARTLRQVESTQNMIRIVGLSATLPNYVDVASFLHVNPMVGLFFFDNGFRPVPLAQQFIGVKGSNPLRAMQTMTEICFEKTLERVKLGHQVLIFVHSRKDTVKTGMAMRDLARRENSAEHFTCEYNKGFPFASRDMEKSRNRELRELFKFGFGIHHAGMLRADRNLVERLFSQGHIKVLVCTATLAWGVNLPAHCVIIKGTQIYNAEKGSFDDIGILDVMQIFGRAGRPQYDTSGEGIIITTHEKLAHYVSQLTQQTPIESRFVDRLTDHLNAEIALGTVMNVGEAIEWLSYTYLYVRMRKNPIAYGIPFDDLEADLTLSKQRRLLIESNAKKLDALQMIRYDPRTGSLSPTDVGRIASHFYIRHDTIEIFRESFKSTMNEADVLALVSKSKEFENIKVREEELKELDEILMDVCVCNVPGGSENVHGKVNILLQNYVSNGSVEDFALISDTAYVAQNSARILRALFEMAVRRSWVSVAMKVLSLAKSVDKRMWPFENPLKQFPTLSPELVQKLEERKLTVDKLRDMEPAEIGHMVHHVRMGKVISQFVKEVPNLQLEVTIQPITRTVLRIQLFITPNFTWNDRVHGFVEPWWIWIEDADNEHIYHSEYFLLHKKMSQETQTLTFNILIFDPMPPQYYCRAVSDRWMGVENVIPISFQHLILPEQYPPHTELLDLHPLPVTALHDPSLESVYAASFTHFNAIQTQIFHTLYHTDVNVLLGAPTGSGKTIAAEIAMWRAFREYPKSKVVYIAPLKALVRERVNDWQEKFAARMNKRIVELTGDVAPDIATIRKADIIITVPEKWDGVSRGWQTRDYVKSVSLAIIDEIHLLGQERGATLEVIVSRMKYISAHTKHSIRIVGLSTALANARDVANWLGIGEQGLFNFRPAVRPVPLEVHISGFSGKHYCPRMATMNKPAYNAIQQYSPDKPVIIFVSSRRQTRLTAQDLISYCGISDNPRHFLCIDERALTELLTQVKDPNLRLSLQFGIGLHHAGLVDSDRKMVEELFVNRKIQVLVATSTLAWGVNTPTHLVIIKGTEYYDVKLKRYVDFPITDVLQMMGRAGRPQFDNTGIACIYVQDSKKGFYQKFLYESFPVESSLHTQLPDHFNAEIAARTVQTKQDVMEYLTWTYYFRRMLINPSYYGLQGVSQEDINRHMSTLIENTLLDLEAANCIEIDEETSGLKSTTLGHIASFYYLHYATAGMLDRQLGRVNEEFYQMGNAPKDGNDDDAAVKRSHLGVVDGIQGTRIRRLLDILSNASEFAELPVRHNEDGMNASLSEKLPWKPSSFAFDSPHVKTHLLLQAHFDGAPLPISDYVTDTKSVLDQSVRVLQAMVDISADKSALSTTLHICKLVQMIKQARWFDDSPLTILPHIDQRVLSQLSQQRETIPSLKDMLHLSAEQLRSLFRNASGLTEHFLQDIIRVLDKLPRVSVQCMFDIGNGDDDTPSSNPNSSSSCVPPRQTITSQRRSDAPQAREISLPADRDCDMIINLTYQPPARDKKGTGKEGVGGGRRQAERKAYTPRFPKAQDMSWWCVLGSPENDELICVKRVQSSSQFTVSLSFQTPSTPGKYPLQMYLVSDSYLGLDERISFTLSIT